MSLHGFIQAYLGGALIGLAASVMLIFNGRVTGISGIYNGLLKSKSDDWIWRAAFILGLVFGGVVMKQLHPEFFMSSTGYAAVRLSIAGFLVGLGTVMGSGCTSGHGICGLSRLSLRSFWATLVFMVFGFITATGMHLLRGN